MKSVFEKVNLNDLGRVAEYIVPLLDEYKVICFYGDMGVGKTTLIKEILNLIKVKDNVSSPSFSLINEYRTADSRIFYHFDFYRINHINEAFDIGTEEYLYSGNLCFIEWPEKVEDLLPTDILKVNITIQNENERKIEIMSN